MTETKPPRYFRTPRAKAGPAREALDAALSDRDLTGMDGITAEIARGAADLVDAARRQQDPRLWLSASGRLLALVGQLDRRPGTVPDDGGGDRDDDGEPDELAAALGSGPTLGDVEES
ncbi:hypothetical protein [Microlunatus parietis]|uniref:Uncharacterized protein n=1 Tax=Microlunatus parietis TaxID=682979 RepID=A0A7Y9I2M8_9ACTN|nr:hypothetical protein [Microlunatus parietis]NYE68871.1 hypothetical protein [Microlunatus parietis]